MLKRNLTFSFPVFFIVDKTLEDPVVLDLTPPSFPEFNRSMLASMNVSQGTEVSKVSPSNNSYVWNWIQCGCEKEAER